ncbi:MAG: phosphotransferase [Dehalococcoidia bacterium]|nr:phosphotransferase [Dehalococcoidia bacterium]
MAMYDIHCHILPGIDDGPEKLEESLAMARMAVADGTDTVVATPHAARVVEKGGKVALEQRILAFSQELHSQAIDLRVLMGVEYLLSMELLQEAQKGAAIGLNGSKYLLMEIDFLQYPVYAYDAMFQLQLLGFVPILAHPERQANIQERPELLAELVARGVLSQVTGGSVLGYFGKEAQRSVEHLLRNNLVHLLASDGHTSSQNRPPVMSEAVAAVERLVGEDAAHCMAVANPSAVIGGTPVTLPKSRPARRRLFPRLGR